jgi:hypothetical protein
MYGTRVGGVSPHQYGLQVTVLVPAATEAAPVKAGDGLKLITTAAYSAAKCEAGETVQLTAIHDVADASTPLGCQLYGFSRIDSFPYSGTAPTIGASVESDGASKMRTAAAANGTFVLYVDTVKQIIEVAMP